MSTGEFDNDATADAAAASGDDSRWFRDVTTPPHPARVSREPFYRSYIGRDAFPLASSGIHLLGEKRRHLVLVCQLDSAEAYQAIGRDFDRRRAVKHLSARSTG